MNIELTNFTLKQADPYNQNHLEFLTSIFQEPQINHFLGNLFTQKTTNTYIVIKNHQEVGYLSLTPPTLNCQNLITTSLYYAISQNYQNQGYATQLIKEISTYLFTKERIDMIVLNINNQNHISLKIAQKLDFTQKIKDQDEQIYIKQRKKSKNK